MIPIKVLQLIIVILVGWIIVNVINIINIKKENKK